jgi:ubiquinol-cytochrome c reductase cytochrome c subunit
MKLRKAFVIGATTLLLGGTGLAQAQGGAESLYRQNCAGCHGASGEGRGSRGVLVDNPAARDAGAVEDVVREGTGGMPAFSHLSDDEVAAIVGHVVELAGGPAGSEDSADGTADKAPGDAEPPAAPLPQGDAGRGESLFLGGSHLSAGGAPCVACHQAGTTGGVGGGSLGSDLTDLHDRMGGEEGVGAALENPLFPVMRASYENRPLTAQERADLAAFFAQVSSGGAGEASLLPPLWLAAGLGSLGLFALMGVVLSRRGRSPAQRIRGKA